MGGDPNVFTPNIDRMARTFAHVFNENGYDAFCLGKWHVPLMIAGEQPMSYEGRGCGKIPGVLVNHVDIAPTALGLCGIEPRD